MNSQILKWRITAVIVVVLLGIVTVLPNFVKLPDSWFLTKEKIKYGLDIQGGLHLVMGVDTKSVMKEKLARVGETVKQELEKENIKVTAQKVERVGDFDQLEMTFESAQVAATAGDKVEKNHYYLQRLEAKDATLVYKFIDSYIFETKKATLEQAIETIRNRIDEFGVAEPSITAQGSDRILIQLPGLKEASSAKDLINRTARLEFMIVSDKMKPNDVDKLVADTEASEKLDLKTMKYSEYVSKLNEALKSKLPENTKVLFEKAPNVDKMELGKRALLLETTTNLNGDSIRDAFVSMGQYNEPEVALHFNSDGAHRMADVSGGNIGRLMAIVLDEVIVSAPVLKSKIPDGRASITLGGGRDYNAQMAEAKLIAMALRSGALPAKLEELEERTVGPSLGADMIAKGKLATVVGAVVVVIFLIVIYRTFGIIANIGLVINILLIFAGLTALGATLTLPGLAGIALTIGMAVDANIIINERIKEELKRGATFAAAVHEGYDRAWSAIIDSNLTGVITAAVLYYFGTGPVRGFSVTMLIGVASTLFSAVFVTHVILEFAFGKMKLKKLSI